MKFYLYILSACTLAFSSLTATNNPSQEIATFLAAVTTQEDTGKADIGKLEGDSYVFRNEGVEYRVLFPNTPQIEKTTLGELASCSTGEKNYGFGIADLSNPRVHTTFQKLLTIFNSLEEKEFSLPIDGENYIFTFDAASSSEHIHINVVAPTLNQFWHFVFAESSCCFFIGTGPEMNLEYFNDFLNGVTVTPIESD